MKKIAVTIFIFLYILYFYNEAFNDGITTLSSFRNTYIDSFNGYLFSMSILISPYLLITQIEYRKSEINIRIKKKCFEYVWLKNIKKIFILLAYLISLFLIFSYIYKFKISFLNINFILRLILYILFCFTLRELFYLMFNSKTIGTGILIIHNFILIGITYAINFYVFNNQYKMIELLYFSEIYEVIVTIFIMFYLYKSTDQKEILK